MDIKKIITLIVIIAAFAGAGVFAYLTFFTENVSDDAGLTTNAANAAATNTILPHGTKLDFSKVESFNKSGTLFPYPKVAPIEVGLQLNDLSQP